MGVELQYNALISIIKAQRGRMGTVFDRYNHLTMKHAILRKGTKCGDIIGDIFQLHELDLCPFEPKLRLWCLKLSHNVTNLCPEQ